MWLAAALCAGTLLGLSTGQHGGLTAAGGVALALVAFLARRAGVPAWAPWVLVLAFARAAALDEPPRAPPCSAVEARELRAAPVWGRWRPSRDGRTGWIEPFPGCARERAHELLFAPELGAPPSGTPVAILPGSEVVPWPRGPAESPRARGFAGLAPVAPDELVRLGAAPSRPWTPLVERLEEELLELRAWLGARAARVERERSAGLLRALAVGARDGLAPERADLFARTGTSHLLSISGWHVGLFAALVVLPLARATPRARRSAAGIAARGALLVAFAAVAGAEKPVVRATLTLLLAQLAALRGRAADPSPRRPDPLSFLGAAFALECLVDPAGIRSLSLVLSYAATLGLVLGTGPLARALRPAHDPFDELRPARALRGVVARFGASLVSGIAASMAAVLATLPFSWSSFGELAPAGALLTLFALLPFAWLSLLAWMAALTASPVLAAPAELGARGLYSLLELGDALPCTPLALPPRPLALLALATALAFLSLHHPAARRAAALAWGLVLLPWSAAPRGLELHLLDVGHGSALVARAPGIEALVFDCGSRDRRGVAGEAVLPLLARWDVARPLVVLSHPDHDHSSGLGRLVERHPIAAWLGAEPAQGLVRPPHGARRVDLAFGRLRWESPCRELGLTLLRGSPAEGNEGSRALELAWRGQRLLLLGDAEEAGLEGLSTRPGPLRLLLAPHHGSDARALGRLLERLPPAEVWISASGEPAVARELERRAIPWRWTGRDGPLALRLP